MIQRVFDPLASPESEAFKKAQAAKLADYERDFPEVAREPEPRQVKEE